MRWTGVSMTAPGLSFVPAGQWKERLENHKKARAAEIKARKEKQRK
ncbi:hypothetical protein OAE92_03170 [Akkermansiaceae bacterium]|nr:hypothetical protein [Akkermansiaceae bacterium]